MGEVGLEGQPSLREFVSIAHRGASGHAPEHTIAAYDLALAHGVHYIELDVHMTRDGVPVVVHDESLDRTGGPEARGLIESRTHEELLALDVGSWFNELHASRRDPRFEGLRIPTLEEVLARYRHCVRFCIELKARDDDGTLTKVLGEMLHDYGLHVPTRGSWRVLVLSFDSPNLERMHEVIPDIPLVEAFEATRATSASIAAELERVGAYATGIAPPKRAVDTALVTAAHERGLTVHPYTVNGYREMAIMMSLGVDGIITDYPDRLDEIVRARRLSARHNPAAPGIPA